MSGAKPSASITSKEAVFCPSIRNGLTELTRETGYFSESSRAKLRQSSKFPSTWRSFEPWAIACASLPIAIFPCGTSTTGVIPALVAYAAALALVFPVEAQMTAFAPSSAALEIAIVIPRSLKEPVGFAPSNLIHTSLSSISEMTHA